jgi:predicted transposase/invertase (TIGR01784 family)
MLSEKNSMYQNILSPLNDLIFKKIFGDQSVMGSTGSFLKSVLDIDAEIVDGLTVINPNQQIDHKNDKAGVLDLKLRASGGEILHVEVQVLNMPSIRERIMYYSCKMITEQIEKGDNYTEIKRVISILISDFKLIKDTEMYHDDFSNASLNSCKVFSDLYKIHILELPKLPQKSDGTKLWAWMKFISARNQEDFDMALQENSDIKPAYDKLVTISTDADIRQLADDREKHLRDIRDLMRGAKLEGIEEAQAISEQNSIVVAKQLLRKGLEVDFIENLLKLHRSKFQ